MCLFWHHFGINPFLFYLRWFLDWTGVCVLYFVKCAFVLYKWIRPAILKISSRIRMASVQNKKIFTNSYYSKFTIYFQFPFPPLFPQNIWAVRSANSYLVQILLPPIIHNCLVFLQCIPIMHYSNLFISNCKNPPWML